MVKKQQDLRQVCNNEFIHTLRSLGSKNMFLNGETLKYKYTIDAPYKINDHSIHPWKK